MIFKVLYNLKYLKKQRWYWLKSTWPSVLLHSGPFPVTSPPVAPAKSLLSSTIPRQGAALYFGAIAEMYLAQVSDKLLQGSFLKLFFSFSVTCPFLLLPLVSSEESAQLLSASFLQPSLHSVPLCRKHPCDAKACIQELLKGCSK